MNDLIEAERRNKYAGAVLKKKSEAIVRAYIREQLRGYHPKTPVSLYYYFYEKNKRRDKDNVAGYAHKVIQDSLVKEGVIGNDGWEHVKEFYDRFAVDPNFPRIEVEIVEPEGKGK